MPKAVLKGTPILRWASSPAQEYVGTTPEGLEEATPDPGPKQRPCLVDQVG